MQLFQHNWSDRLRGRSPKCKLTGHLQLRGSVFAFLNETRLLIPNILGCFWMTRDYSFQIFWGEYFTLANWEAWEHNRLDFCTNTLCRSEVSFPLCANPQPKGKTVLELQFTVNQIPLRCISHLPKIPLEMAWGDSLIFLTWTGAILSKCRSAALITWGTW